jgi:hypothetical protein
MAEIGPQGSPFEKDFFISLQSRVAPNPMRAFYMQAWSVNELDGSVPETRIQAIPAGTTHCILAVVVLAADTTSNTVSTYSMSVDPSDLAGWFSMVRSYDMEPALYISMFVTDWGLAGSWNPSDPATALVNYYTTIRPYILVAEAASLPFVILVSELSTLFANSANTARFNTLFTSARSDYTGQLGLSVAVYDESDIIPATAQVADFIGVHAYVPLAESDNPTILTMQTNLLGVSNVDDMRSSYPNGYIPKIRDLAKNTWQRPIFVTAAFKSTVGVAKNPTAQPNTTVDEEIQMKCWKAFLNVFPNFNAIGIGVWSREAGATDNDVGGMGFTTEGKLADSVFWPADWSYITINPSNSGMYPLKIDWVKSYVQSVDSGYIYQSADSDLIPAGRRVLDYLWNLRSKSDQKTLTGQGSKTFCDTVFSECGVYPAIISEHIMNHWNSYPGDVGSVVRETAYTHWQNGGLTLLLLTPFNPKNHAVAETSDSIDFTTDDMISVVTSGSTLNTDLNTQLNTIIGHLQWLQDRGVPVLATPYYSVTQGDRWWWSARTSDDARYTQYINLWKYTLTYIMNQGVHNCIWVWCGSIPSEGSNRPANFTANHLPTPYSSWLDVAGCTAFKTTSGDLTWTSSDIGPMTQINNACGATRLIALPDMGNIGLNDSTYRADNRKTWTLIKNFFPNMCFFAMAYGRYGLTNAYNDYNNETVHDSWAVNRDDLPPF